MILRDIWEDIECGFGDSQLPKELIKIFNDLDEIVKDANGLRGGLRDEYGLKSTQVIGLVILLWNMGILKGSTNG